MKQVMALVAAGVLTLAVTSTALGAAPYRENDSGSGYDDFTSSVCGFDVWLTYRSAFTAIAQADGSYETTFQAERFRTGPRGSVKQLVHYTWTSPDGFQVIGDPESGEFTEVIHETLHGSRVWSVPGGGVIYRDSGTYEAIVTITYTPDADPTVEVTDEVSHGTQPGGLSEEELNALLCETLG